MSLLMSESSVNRKAESYGKVAVVMGGWSAEREVSLMSGERVLSALIASGINAHAVDASRDVINTISNSNYDRVFNILHGRGGEDGLLQGALEIKQIPYTGSGVLASALSMNKQMAKEICATQNILTPPWRVVGSLNQCKEAADQIGLPVVVKPVAEGSSVGISIVKEVDSIQFAWKLAAKFGSVMVEKYISGTEVTAGILQQHALPLVSMSTKNSFYDYAAKYLDESTEYFCPSGLSSMKEEEIKNIALVAFNLLGAKGWGRVDFIVDENGCPYFIELNTIPGLTSHSLLPIAAKENGISIEDLCKKILDSSFNCLL